jgi:AhpD family alkylhydroperoxidase
MNIPMLSGYALLSLGRALSHPLSLRGKFLGPRLREMVILRVSSINGCPVCSAFHETFARIQGMDDAEILEARSPQSDDRLDEQTQLLLHYAEIRTANLEKDFDDVVQRFETTFSEEIKREVRAIVDLFSFNNRFNNTWEGLLPGARRRRQAMGLSGPQQQ